MAASEVIKINIFFANNEIRTSHLCENLKKIITQCYAGKTLVNIQVLFVKKISRKMKLTEENDLCCQVVKNLQKN